MAQIAWCAAVRQRRLRVGFLCVAAEQVRAVSKFNHRRAENSRRFLDMDLMNIVLWVRLLRFWCSLQTLGRACRFLGTTCAPLWRACSD